MASVQTLPAWAVGHALQGATLIGAMLEKIAAMGSGGRRTEGLPAFKQPHMSSSILSRRAAIKPIRHSGLARTSANREFFARFLLDTHCPFKGHSTRHSDTSRNGRRFSGCIKSARATRHLNATLVTRHSNAKFQPVLPSLFFQSAPRICPASFSGRARSFGGRKTTVFARRENPQERRLSVEFRICVMYSWSGSCCNAGPLTKDLVPSRQACA
jgi:hypothetical protein